MSIEDSRTVPSNFSKDVLIPEEKLTNTITEITSVDESIFFNPFSVQLGDQITTSDEAFNSLKTMLADDTEAIAALDTYQEQLIDNEAFINFKKTIIKKARDTSPGGNDAINCYPQFHEDDDIVPLYNRFYGDRYDIGLGRVYDETIDSKQQIMWITAGVPEFSNLKEYFLNNIDSSLSRLMNNGEYSKFRKISRLAGTVIGTVLTLPLIPLKWFTWFWGATKYPVSKFYDLKASMPLYYRIVNSILAHMSVNMGITEIEEEIQQKDMIDLEVTDTAPISTPYTSFTESSKATVDQVDGSSVSDIFNQCGVDIFSILSRRDIFDGLVDESQLKSLDEHIEELQSETALSGPDGLFSKFISGFSKQLTRSMDFIGIRIEKSVDSTESLSNQSGQPEIAEMTNSKIAAAKSKMISLAMGNVTGTAAEGAIKSLIHGASDVLQGALSSVTVAFGITDPAGALSTFMGSGYYDFPDVYQSSSFTKSYSFKMSLDAVYGDPLSILYKLYLPLALIMPVGFPRAIGKTAYTSPFVLRAYSRGKFAIPLGMIDNLTITRGSDEFGWNYAGLPLSLDVTFSIKDLSPIMYVALQTNWFRSIFGNNSTFQEYLLTLSNVGLEERVMFIERLKKRCKISYKLLFDNILNPELLGYQMGDLKLAKSLVDVIPNTKLPESLKATAFANTLN